MLTLLHYIKDSAYFYVFIYPLSTKEQILFYFGSEVHMSLNDFMKNTFLMSLLRDISLREVLHPQVQRLLLLGYVLLHVFPLSDNKRF